MITFIEELSMNAWPALQTKLYDGWVLRFANGYTWRANSINPVYRSTIPLPEKVQFCEEEYQRLDLPIIYKLTSDSQPEDIDFELGIRGYQRTKEVSIKLLPIVNYQHQKSSDVHISTEFSDQWFRGFFKCSGIIDEKYQITSRKMLRNIPNELVCVSKYIDNKVVGCGFGTIERDSMGIFDIVVAEGFRGNGYGKEIMHSILNMAKKKSLKIAYLQVAVGNTVAENLYNKLGFKDEYKYWYRVKNRVI